MAGTQSKCRATTTKGRSCQNPAMIGASRCSHHRGEWSSYTAGKGKTANGGKKKTAARRKK